MKALNIAILAQLDSPTITQHLTPELKQRGHTVDIIDLSCVPHQDFETQPEIQALAAYDVVYYRSGLDPSESEGRIFKLESFIEQHSSIHGVNLQFTKHPLINSKQYQLETAHINGMETPHTIPLKQTSYAELADKFGNCFVIKPDSGTQGQNVKRIQSEQDWDEAIEQNTEDFICQSFIPHEFEYRAQTLGNDEMSLYKRVPPKGDFRSNISLGGTMLPIEKNHEAELTRLTAEVQKLFDFEIIAIDFMVNTEEQKFVLTEINLNPGWQNSNETVTGINFSQHTAIYFENLCS